MFQAAVGPPSDRAIRCSAVHTKSRSARLAPVDAASILAPQYQQHPFCRRAAVSRSFASLEVIAHTRFFAAKTIRADYEADVRPRLGSGLSFDSISPHETAPLVATPQ